MISNTNKKIILAVCVIVILGLLIAESGSLVNASGKKKFLKGFILGALLSKSHYPVIYSMPSHHGGGHGGGHGGYGW